MISLLHQISEIYEENCLHIQQNPEALSYVVLSRIKDRSPIVTNFAKSSGLILQNSFISNENVKFLFLCDKNEKIIRTYWEFDGPLLFIQTNNEYTKSESDTIHDNDINLVDDDVENEDWEDVSEDTEIRSIFYVVNEKTKKKLSSIACNEEANYIQIIITKNTRAYNTKNDINGYIYFVFGNKLCSSFFNNSPSIVKEYDEIIESILLLDAFIVLIKFKNNFILLDTKSKKNIFESMHYEKMLFIKVNISENTVYSANDYGKIDSILVVLGSENLIQIYRFERFTKKFYIFCQMESNEIYSFSEYSNNNSKDEFNPLSVFIDREYLIDNSINKLLKADKPHLIKFAIEDSDKDVVRIVEVDNAGTFNIFELFGKQTLDDVFTEDVIDTKFSGRIKSLICAKYNKNMIFGFDNEKPIDPSIFIGKKHWDIEEVENDNQTKLKILEFLDDRVILKYKEETLKWKIYLFDVVEKRVIDSKIIYANDICSVEGKLLIAFATYTTLCIFNIVFYTIDDKGVNELMDLQLDYPIQLYSSLNDFKLKDANFYWIYKDDGFPPSPDSIAKLNYFIAASNPPYRDVAADIEKNVCFIDMSHVLSELKRPDEFFEIAIINVSNFTLITSIKMDEKQSSFDYETDEHVNGVIVLGCHKKYLLLLNENEPCLYIYRIDQEHDSKQFKFDLVFEKILCNYKPGTYDQEYISKFHFEDNGLWMTWYRNENDFVEIENVEFEENGNTNEYINRTYTVELTGMKLDRDRLTCLLTPKSKYLVIWELNFKKPKKLLYIYNDGLLQQKLIMSEKIDDVLSLPNSDNLLVCDWKRHTILKLDLIDCDGLLVVNILVLQDYQKDEIYRIKIENNILFVVIYNKFIEIYDLLKGNIEDICPFVKKQNVGDFCVSMNRKYVITETDSEVESIFKLNVLDMNGMKQVACLHLDKEFYNLIASEKYVSIALNSNPLPDKLLCFEIVN